MNSVRVVPLGVELAIVLPQAIIEKLGVSRGDMVEYRIEGETVELRRVPEPKAGSDAGSDSPRGRK